MTSTATMQAAVLEQHEAPFRLSSVARPVPGPGQALVRIAASAVNPLDIKIRAGAAAHARHPLPAILGLDPRWRRRERGPRRHGIQTR